MLEVELMLKRISERSSKNGHRQGVREAGRIRLRKVRPGLRSAVTTQTQMRGGTRTQDFSVHELRKVTQKARAFLPTSPPPTEVRFEEPHT